MIANIAVLLASVIVGLYLLISFATQGMGQGRGLPSRYQQAGSGRSTLPTASHDRYFRLQIPGIAIEAEDDSSPSLQIGSASIPLVNSFEGVILLSVTLMAFLVWWIGWSAKTLNRLFGLPNTQEPLQPTE